MLVDVDVEFLAIALVFPVGDFIADAEEIGIAAEIEIADEHAAKVTEMADAAFAKAQRSKKGEGGHDGYNPFHFDGDRDRKEIGAAIGEQYCAGDEDSENCAGSADGRHVGIFPAPEHGNRFHDDVEETSANSGEEVVAKKAIAAPHEFHFATEHPQREHVQNDVPDAVDIVQEKIGERLPDAKQRNDSGGNQTEPFQKPIVAVDAAEIVDEGFQDVHREVGDDEELHARSNVEIEAEAIVADGSAGSHAEVSLRSLSGGSKERARRV